MVLIGGHAGPATPDQPGLALAQLGQSLALLPVAVSALWLRQSQLMVVLLASFPGTFVLGRTHRRLRRQEMIRAYREMLPGVPAAGPPPAGTQS